MTGSIFLLNERIVSLECLFASPSDQNVRIDPEEQYGRAKQHHKVAGSAHVGSDLNGCLACRDGSHLPIALGQEVEA